LRNIREIDLQEIVLHVLESRKRELTLADYPLQLAGNPALIDYFSDHIRASLNEPAAKAAKFRMIQPGHTSGICEDILAGRITLLNGSRLLAQLLYNVMITNAKITPADLAVCLYRDRLNPEIMYLAILKIDPSKVFEQEIVIDDNGLGNVGRGHGNDFVKNNDDPSRGGSPQEPDAGYTGAFQTDSARDVKGHVAE